MEPMKSRLGRVVSFLAGPIVFLVTAAQLPVVVADMEADGQVEGVDYDLVRRLTGAGPPPAHRGPTARCRSGIRPLPGWQTCQCAATIRMCPEKTSQGPVPTANDSFASASWTACPQARAGWACRWRGTA